MSEQRGAKPDFVLRIEFENATTYFYAYRDSAGVIRRTNVARQNVTGDDVYDSKGAMYFAVAVILIYGVSIALLIGTTLRRSNADYEVKGFLRSYARLDTEKKSKEKMKMRRRLIEKNMLPVFPGCSLAAAAGIFDERMHGTGQGTSGNVDSPNTGMSVNRKPGSGHEDSCSSSCVLDLLLDMDDIAYIDESPDKPFAQSVIVEEDEDLNNKSGSTTSEELSPPALGVLYSEVTVHCYGIQKASPL